MRIWADVCPSIYRTSGNVPVARGTAAAAAIALPARSLPAAAAASANFAAASATFAAVLLQTPPPGCVQKI